MSASTTPPTATVAGAITNSGGQNFSAAVASLKINLATAALHGAPDVPEAINEIGQMNPAYAAWVQGKSALGSKTIVSGIVTHALAWAVGYYGLGWTAADTETVAGLISWGLMTLFHYISKVPVTSILPQMPRGAG